MPKYLLDIKSDVAAIKRAIIGSTAEPDKQPSVNPPVGKSSTFIGAPVQSRASEHQKTLIERLETSNTLPNRDARGSFVSGINAPSAVESAIKPVAPLTVAERLGKAPRKAAVTPTKRDTSGRFTGNGNDESGNESPRDTDGAVTALANRLSALSGIGSGLEEADPTVKAFQEIAEPMKRGFEFFGGGKDDKQTKWLRNILGVLKLSRKEETVYQKATQKTLKAIEGKSVGGADDNGGIMGMLGRFWPILVAAISSIGGLILSGLGAFFAPLAGIGGAIVSGLGAVLSVVFSPIGLAIGAAALVAWGLFTESGQKFFGEVGAKIIAGWDAVTTAFAPITDAISKGWDTVKGGFDSLISGMVSSWDRFTGFLKDKFGIDIPAIFKPVVDVSKKVVEAATETVKGGVDVAKNTAGKAVEAIEKNSPKTTEALGNVWNKAKNGAQNIADHATGRDKGLGYISSRYEGNIGSAHKDNIGSAYGKYQFNTEGGLPKFLKDNPQYAAQLAEGGAPGSAGFNKKWEQIAKDDPSGFLAAQEASGRKQYYDPAIKKAESLGFNTGDRGIQEAMFSGAVQHGGWNSKVLPRIAENYDLKSMSAPEQLKAIYAERRKYASENLKGSDLKNVLARYDNEESNTLDLSKSTKNDTSAVVPPQPSIADDPTQGGRYKYETLEGGKVQVTDNQTGVMELASDEQANAYRKQQGKPYLDKVAAINSGDMSMYNRLAAGPSNTAAMVSAPVPSAPVMPTSPKIADAPPVIEPLSTPEQRPLTVNVAAQDVGQDVSDRRIAHIVTGGLSGHG
ncbi:MAG: VgrG-related protein [Methylobacter sp.]